MTQPYIILNTRQLYDLELIINGGFYPLKGFMTEKDYLSVLNHMRLSGGQLFPLPIVLNVNNQMYNDIKDFTEIILKDEEGYSLAVLKIEDIYKPNIELECIKAYGTMDDNHPYVKLTLKNKDDYYIGGKIIKHLQLPRHYDFRDIRLTPNETKKYFQENGWENIVGFQTRNPMHKSHFELTKYALDSVGSNAKLLLHPCVGITQDCDIDYHTRVRCYKKILKYWGDNKVLLSLLPLSMRMAGPKEALLHALIRQNYGCTHFIIGRGHAEPSYMSKEGLPFYEPYDAHKLVGNYQNELNIKIIFSESICYIKELNTYLPSDKITAQMTPMNISGTQQRNMLRKGEDIPDWFTFKEVKEELVKEFKKNGGLCLYFVGLSGSGKSTLSNAIIQKIKEDISEKNITLLDGDIVRQHLSKGLGFSKEDRSTNVRRIGYVASEIVKHSGIVVVANIAPYQIDRDYNREIIGKWGKYIEIYVDTDINICEERDAKGLYKLAKKGLISNFTGISDPFEKPINPDIILNGNEPIEYNLNIIFNYLKDNLIFLQ